VLGIIFINVGNLKPSNALLAGVALSAVIAGLLFLPLTMTWTLFPDRMGLHLRADAGRAGHDLHHRHDHQLLHRDALRPRAQDRQGLGNRPRDQHHRRPGRRPARDAAAGLLHRLVDPGFLLTSTASTAWPSRW
jgi:hypothetical protein